MKSIQNIRKKPAAKPVPTGHTNPAGLYDRHGPIPVADVDESDADSVWALFQESSAPQAGDSVLPTGDAPFENTVPAPLKP